MKVKTKHEQFASDIFDMVHLFIQDTQLDENKPHVFFDMQKGTQTIFLKFNIHFEGEILSKQKTLDMFFSND